MPSEKEYKRVVLLFLRKEREILFSRSPVLYLREQSRSDDPMNDPTKSPK